MEIISDTVVCDLSFNIAARVRIKDKYGETPSVNTVENACVVGDMDILYYDDETDTFRINVHEWETDIWDLGNDDGDLGAVFGAWLEGALESFTIESLEIINHKLTFY